MIRKRKTAHANGDRWLVSYADFITLLFAFFVVMYAASRLDRQKMLQVAASIEDAFQTKGLAGPPLSGLAAEGKPGAETGSSGAQRAPELRSVLKPRVPAELDQQGVADHDLEPLKREIERALEIEIKKGAVTLRTGPDGLIISLSELGFFDSGSARMRQAGEPSFHRIAKLLSDKHCGVRVEGHTDNVPIRTAEFKSNWDLSTARATEIVKSLIDDYQFAPSLLSAAGYAQFHPIASNDTAEGRQQNRRVDLVVLSYEASPRDSTKDSDVNFAVRTPGPSMASPGTGARR